MVEAWNPNQHLYVKGELGVPTETLDRLEQWLDDEGQNWTVLLTQNSSGETYRDASGDNYKQIDAVEHALIKGLQARTKFGELRHPETNQRNGALLIIYLKERQFSYYGSDHYSANGAPPGQWANGLDSEAKKAMRSGGRIVDAVKNTVTSIDRKVMSTISNRKARRATQLEKAKQDLASLNQRIAEITEKRAWALSKIDGDGGDIARLQIDELKQKAATLKNAPGTYDLNQLLSIANQWSGLLDQFQSAPKRFTGQQQLIQDTTAESDEAQVALMRAQTKLDDAIKLHQLGNFSYQQSLSDSMNITSSVAALDRDARRKEELIAAREEAKKQSALHAAQKRSLTLKVGSATGAGFLGLLGVAGNRRRRRIKEQAEQLLASRKLEMKETEDRLFKLMDRSSVIVGPLIELENRGYSGDTLSLSKKGLKQIDEAFVLSSNVQKIIEEAEDLIEPVNPLSRSRNLVSRGRYEDAVDLLDAELNIGLTNVPLLKERARPGEDADEVFSLPIDAWQERTADALDTASQALDQVEEAWSTIVSRSEKLSGNIDALKARQEEIQRDDWLRCEATFTEWIPAMSKSHQRAISIGKSDPVHALTHDMSVGDRMASEAKDLLDHITTFRKTHWEELQKNEAVLDQRKRTTLWVDDTLIELNKNADRLALESQSEDVSELVAELASGLSTLSSKVKTGAELIIRADENANKAIKSAENLVNKIRREIGTALDLKPEDALIEEGLNPSHFLKKARLQHDASLAALDLGEIQSAEGFLDEVDALTKHAAQLARDSRKVLDEYAGNSEALWRQRGKLVDRGEQMNREAGALRVRYIPRALFLDPEAPASGTYADAPAQLEALLKGIVKRLDRAKTRFTEGGLLEARDLMIDGTELVSEGKSLCADVIARSKSLEKLEESNTAKFESHRRAQADLKGQMKDRRITRETIALFETIGSRLDQTESEIQAGDGKRDPYLVEDLLEELSERLPNLRKDIGADFEEHSRTLQLVDTVSRNQEEATQLWKTADNDRIANSPATNKSMAAIESCHAQLEDVRRDLQVDHGNWREIQNNLRSLHLSLSEAVLDLKRELTLARESVRAIDAATHEVHKAARWSGSHGIRISGNYGSRSLAAANDVMQHGLYQEALQMAGQARTRARRAIADAEAREAAKRRAEEAARRRRRQAARHSSFSSGTSSRSRFGSSSSSFSGGSRSSSSSSSGMGRSSFGSGSGMGRSGW